MSATTAPAAIPVVMRELTHNPPFAQPSNPHNPFAVLSILYNFKMLLSRQI